MISKVYLGLYNKYINILSDEKQERFFNLNPVPQSWNQISDILFFEIQIKTPKLFLQYY